MTDAGNNGLSVIEPEVPGEIVYVGDFGNPAEKVPWIQGLTLLAALKEAGIEFGPSSTITIGGKPVRDLNIVLRPNVIVMVSGRVSNGQ